MQIDCPECGHILEFSSDRPLYCAYCGKPLSRPGDPTEQLDPEATRPAVFRPDGEIREAPRSVGNYRLLRPLGGGGMGTVYEAADPASGRHVALKLIAPEYATAPEAVERFRQEGRLASMIAHPRCVFVFAADEDSGRPYIVMELMPGDTLQEMTDRQGPLPPEEAVAKALDVIEGLQEAHRLGVIHRDVKPSNCFVQPDGRVKVGDFGLAKSLVGSASLTRSGTFLGTLLYAPPEQIKGEEIDFRTDVYSVAATLYHLLTGRAPFQGKDPAATLARTVSERPPSLRSHRPGLSRGLERVVLRGLERDRNDRWRDLEEFRQALLPFAPGQLVPAGPGARLGAFLIDFLLVLPLWALLLIVLVGMPATDRYDARHVLIRALELLPLALLEGIRGWSPGKWLLRLRVVAANGPDPPGFGRGLLRVLVFYAFTWLPHDILVVLFPGGGPGVGPAPGVTLLGVAGEVLGSLLLNAPLRARNGYRGLHELASGTRVIRLPWAERRQPLRPRHPDRLTPGAPPAGLPVRLGRYLLRGTLQDDADRRLLLAEDSVLGRPVWLRVHSGDGQALSAARRELGRPTRLPWLAGGEQDGLSWDAFLAPQGSPLGDLVEPRAPLSWGQLRPLLLQLADELIAACADGTLPRRLTAGQVWVQPSGRVQLLDRPLPEPPADDADCPGATASARALALLHRVAILALEGRLRPETAGTRVHAPIPGSARRLLNRLTGFERPYETAEQVQADLIALQGEPTEVSTAMRWTHLALLVAVLSPALLVMLSARYWAMQRALQGLSDRVAATQTALEYLERPERRQVAADWVKGSDYLKRRSPAEWRDLLGRRLAEDRERWDGLRRAVQWDWLARLVLLEAYGRPEFDRVKVAEFTAADFERAARHADPDHTPGAGHADPALWAVVVPPLWCVLWALLTRGGLTFRLAGLALRRASGRRAGRLQCAWRALLFWAPVAGPLALSVWVQTHFAGQVALAFGLWCAAVGVLVGEMLLALWSPARAPHDRLSGTYLVPR